MSGPQPRFGIPKYQVPEITLHSIGDDRIFYRYETVIWVDTGKESREPHVYVAWKCKTDDVYSRVLSDSEIPTEILLGLRHETEPKVGETVEHPIIIDDDPRDEESVESMLPRSDSRKRRRQTRATVE